MKTKSLDLKSKSFPTTRREGCKFWQSPTVQTSTNNKLAIKTDHTDSYQTETTLLIIEISETRHRLPQNIAEACSHRVASKRNVSRKTLTSELK